MLLFRGPRTEESVREHSHRMGVSPSTRRCDCNSYIVQPGQIQPSRVFSYKKEPHDSEVTRGAKELLERVQSRVWHNASLLSRYPTGVLQGDRPQRSVYRIENRVKARL